MGLFMKLFQKCAKVNADQKHDYDLTYDNVAIPEIHTHKVKESDVHEEDLKDMTVLPSRKYTSKTRKRTKTNRYYSHAHHF